MQPTLGLPNPEDWVDVPQAAEMIGVAKSTIFDLINKGKINGYKIGGVRVLWRADVKRFADAYRITRRRQIIAAGARTPFRHG